MCPQCIIKKHVSNSKLLSQHLFFQLICEEFTNLSTSVRVLVEFFFINHHIASYIGRPHTQAQFSVELNNCIAATFYLFKTFFEIVLYTMADLGFLKGSFCSAQEL